MVSGRGDAGAGGAAWVKVAKSLPGSSRKEEIRVREEGRWGLRPALPSVQCGPEFSSPSKPPRFILHLHSSSSGIPPNQCPLATGSSETPGCSVFIPVYLKLRAEVEVGNLSGALWDFYCFKMKHGVKSQPHGIWTFYILSCERESR